MDRNPVRAASDLAAPVLTPTPQEPNLNCLTAYWRALGVEDPARIEALSEEALRYAASAAPIPELDPTGQALAAASALLDDWLARVLEVAPHSPELRAARAALLSGAAPDWPAALFTAPDEADDTVLHQVRAALAQATPPPSPGVMPTQRIALFRFLGPLYRLWRLKRRTAA